MINEYIKQIEKLNLEYINLKAGEVYQIGEKVRKFRLNGFRGLIESIRRRFLFKTISQNFADENLPYEQQQSMARLGNPNIKVAVYTCVTGNYDRINNPYMHYDNTDFYLYTDALACSGWNIKKIDNYVDGSFSNAMKNRYIKFHPFELFAEEYDYAIYIDGNVTPITDLSVLCEYVNKQHGLAFHSHCSRNCVYEEGKACKALNKGNYKMINNQLVRYKKENFPEKYGMIEGNVFVVDLSCMNAKKILDNLWDELLKSESGRDQLAWPYVFWKNNISVSEICTLGKNVYKNAKVRIDTHI